MTKRKTHIFIVLAYTIITLVMTWPVVGKLATHVAGSGGDPWQTMWRFETKARGGLSLFVRDVLGQGEPHLANLSVWPWMPFHLVFGEPVAYNVVWLLSFVLSGYAMYLLVLALTRPSKGSAQIQISKSKHPALAEWITDINLPALLVGLYYMFLPFHVAHSFGHFGAMQLEWLPFILLVGLLWWQKPKIWKLVVLGVLLTIQAWTEHHYLLWLAIFCLFVLVARFRSIRAEARRKLHYVRRNKKRAQFCGGVAITVAFLVFGVLLPYRPTARLALAENTPLELGQQQLVRFSADLFAFVVPAPFHSLWGQASDTIFAGDFTGNVAEATQYLGISILLLIVFFHRAIPTRAKQFWISAALLFFVIALGPQLHMFGRVTGIPLPYALIDSIPGISSVRAVARAGVFVGLSVAVLLGYVLAAQLRRIGAVIVVSIVLLLEFLFVPAPVQSFGLTPAYDALKKLPGKTVIEIPAATNYVAASQALYGTLIHEKDVVADIALERAEDPATLAEMKALPAVKQLLFVRMTDLRENRTEFFGQDLAETLPDAMKWIDAAGIIIHSDSISPLQRATLLRFLDTQPNLSGRQYGDAILYAPNNTVTKSDGVFLTRDGRWQSVGYDVRRGASFAEIPSEASITLINVTDSPKQVRLIVPLAPESESNIEMLWNGESVLSRQLLTLPPGAHTITMRRVGNAKAIIMNPQLIVQ